MTTMTQTMGTSGTTDASAGKLFGQALLGGAIAAGVNAVLFLGAKASGVSLAGEFQPGTLGELVLPAVVISSLVPGLFAALAALLLQKFTQAPARNFAILAVAFGVLSLGGPASVKQISAATIVVMALMHVVAGVGIGGLLFRALKRS